MRTQDNLAYLQGHLLRRVAAICSRKRIHNPGILEQRRLPKHLRVHVSAYWRKAVEEVGGIVCTGKAISSGASSGPPLPAAVPESHRGGRDPFIRI